MTKLTFKQLNDASEEYDLILFDLWGVVVEGGEIYPGVIDAINNIYKKTDIMFLTNAPRPALEVANNLRKWGVSDVTEDMVLTSGDVARDAIKNTQTSLGGRTPIIYHLGEDRNDDILKRLDHELTKDLSKTDILLLSLYRDEDEDINEFDSLLKEAAELKIPVICSNPDTTIPKQGTLRYCAGHFAGIVEKFGSSVLYTGKPKTIIYDVIFQRKQGIKKNKILMVGDTFETDILGATDSGIDSALVLTGNSGPFHNTHKNMDDKLTALFNRGKEIGIMPTFVTSIT